MIAFLVAFMLAILLPAHAQRACDKATSFHHVNATGPVEIVAGIEGKRVYLCGFTIAQKGNTLDFHVLFGKGTDCVTERIEPFYLEFPNDVAMASRSDIATHYTEPGQSVCIQTTGSNAKLGGVLYWAQF